MDDFITFDNDSLWRAKFKDLTKQLDRIKQAKGRMDGDIRQLQSEVEGLQLYVHVLLGALVAKGVVSREEIDRGIQRMLQSAEDAAASGATTPEEAAAQTVYNELGLFSDKGL